MVPLLVPNLSEKRSASNRAFFFLHKGPFVKQWREEEVEKDAEWTRIANRFSLGYSRKTAMM
jgi:hypothetical protein